MVRAIFLALGETQKNQKKDNKTGHSDQIEPGFLSQLGQDQMRNFREWLSHEDVKPGAL